LTSRIDQSGTNVSVAIHWFFADIRERCENGKYSGMTHCVHVEKNNEVVLPAI
jgi:hypothetical protein